MRICPGTNGSSWAPSGPTVSSATRVHEAHSRTQLYFLCLLLSGSIHIYSSTNCQISPYSSTLNSWDSDCQAHPGGLWKVFKMFPSDQVPSLAPAVMVIGAARAELSAVTGSIMSTTMSWQVPYLHFVWRNPYCIYHVSLNHNGLPLPHFVAFSLFPCDPDAPSVYGSLVTAQTDVTSVMKVVFLWPLPSPSWSQLLRSLLLAWSTAMSV